MNDINKPLVSVILPLYNGERYIAAALKSVFAQDYRPIECIVVDDMSTDGGPDVVSRFPTRYLRQRVRSGPGAARNAGIRLATGSLFAFLDQDDQWTPNKLSSQVDLLLSDPELGFVTCLQDSRLEDGASLPRWISQDQFENDGGMFPGMLLTTRQAFEKVGRFREEFLNASDADWFVRAVDLGVPHARVDERLLIRRIHAENQSRDVRKTHDDLLRIARDSVRRRREQQVNRAS